MKPSIRPVTLLLAVRAAAVLLLAGGDPACFVRPVGGWTFAAQLQQRNLIDAPSVHSKSSASARDGRARRLLSLSSSPTTGSAAGSAAKNAASDARQVDKRPLLDFALLETVDVVDRLDDAIMGGISTSAVVYSRGSSNNENSDSFSAGYAKWFGVCREDGGGFCGWRTNPFKAALNVSRYDGLYVTARLSSDDDLHRRVWKISTRTRPDRGEQLYQAPLLWSTKSDPEGWRTCRVPFESFRLVRGPRIVPDGPPLNVSNGIFQIGMTMGKFKFGGGGGSSAANGTEIATTLEDFRPGFFQLDLKEIGAYKAAASEPVQAAAVAIDTTDTATTSDAAATVVAPYEAILTKAEAKKVQPMWIRVLAPVLKLVFLSEARQRRKSALRLLQRRYNFNGWQAIGFILRQRAQCVGYPRAFIRACRIAAEEAVRFVLVLPLRVALLYPIRIVGKLTRRRGPSSGKLKEDPSTSN